MVIASLMAVNHPAISSLSLRKCYDGHGPRDNDLSPAAGTYVHAKITYLAHVMKDFAGDSIIKARDAFSIQFSAGRIRISMSVIFLLTW
jgi:hypothetical protein